MAKYIGRCLCSNVSVIATKVNKKVEACHCQMCRRWGGGPFLEVTCGTEVEFSGEENICIYDSSEWAERSFCRQCGTHLFYRIKESREYCIPVGIFDGLEDLVFETQVFIDQKPSYYSFSNQTTDLTSAELFAMYQGSDNDSSEQ